MFTKDQIEAINRYFAMVGRKLSELYHSLPETEKKDNINLDLDEHTKIGFGINYLIYLRDAAQDDFEYVRVNLSYPLKEIYFSSNDCLFVECNSGGGIDSLNINNSRSLMTNSTLLKKFNLFIKGKKKKIQELINIVANHYKIPAPVLEDFQIPDFVMEEPLVTEDLEKITILAAALRRFGKVFLGNDHASCVNHIDMDIYTVDVSAHHYSKDLDSGYITNEGKFVDCDTAWKIACENGLIEENVQCFTKNSEDFYRACKSHFNIAEARKKLVESLHQPGDEAIVKKLQSCP